MAVDGVAPRAKMNQQRGRRFRSAREAEQNEKKAKDKGEKLPEEERFDSNCITPGTPFMVRLQEQLKYFVNNKISTDGLWKGTKVKPILLDFIMLSTVLLHIAYTHYFLYPGDSIWP